VQALARVPRHRFVPASLQALAYQDTPLPIGHDQTISQPYIVALMTELAEVGAADVVLEIGTGSGYQAAVLAEIAREVYTIEIIEPLGRGAARVLEQLGYDNVTVRVGDGYAGWPERAPFDAILVTAAPEVVPPALIEQLKPGGRLVIPVGAEYATQTLRVLEKTSTGELSATDVLPVRFVPFLRDDD
jgi:protein-L-isoaspartate(D-aspartate) O-methyltransferase